MGLNLVARGNLTGAVEFYRLITKPTQTWPSACPNLIFSYAYSLNPVIQESYQCLFVTKCGYKRQQAGLPLSDPNVPEGDDAAFWEKSWRVSFLTAHSNLNFELSLFRSSQRNGSKTN